MRSATWLWLIAVVFVFSAQAWSADLHLFIVADVSGEGAGDIILREAVKNDVAAVRFEVDLIAKNTGLKVKEKSFINEGISLQKLVSSLKKIPASSNDVVFFYFSGHGYTTASQFEDPWPNLVIRNRGLKFSYVIEIIKASSARLKILFADCCNNILPEAYAPIVIKGIQIAKGNNRRNYKNLFLRQSGAIILAGCKKSQVSLATAEGSFCSNCFFKSLHETVNNPSSISNWQSLLDLASYKLYKQAQKYSRDQDLFFVIED